MTNLSKNRRHQEEGAVLLTTLLVMSIMAALAVAILDDVRYAVKRASNVQAYAQTDWYVQGAGDFAENYFQNQLINASPEQLNGVLLQDQPIIFPIEGGLMTLSVLDGSHCFSLADLSGTQGRLVFPRLLKNLGWTEAMAAQLTSIALDWQDEGSALEAGGAEDYTYLGRIPAYRTSNQPFSSITELRALATMTEERFQRLRPFICARPSSSKTKVNINTLTVANTPILAAIIGGVDSQEIARRLIVERPASGYSDLEQLRLSPVLPENALKDALLDLLSFKPHYVWVEADVSYLQARGKAAFEFSIDGSRVVRLYQGFGEDVFRPRLETPPT